MLRERSRAKATLLADPFMLLLYNCPATDAWSE
jgi:hypothetical protein